MAPPAAPSPLVQRKLQRRALQRRSAPPPQAEAAPPPPAPAATEDGAQGSGEEWQAVAELEAELRGEPPASPTMLQRAFGTMAGWLSRSSGALAAPLSRHLANALGQRWGVEVTALELGLGADLLAGALYIHRLALGPLQRDTPGMHLQLRGVAATELTLEAGSLGVARMLQALLQGRYGALGTGQAKLLLQQLALPEVRLEQTGADAAPRAALTLRAELAGLQVLLHQDLFRLLIETLQRAPAPGQEAAAPAWQRLLESGLKAVLRLQRARVELLQGSWFTQGQGAEAHRALAQGALEVRGARAAAAGGDDGGAVGRLDVDQLRLEHASLQSGGVTTSLEEATLGGVAVVGGAQGPSAQVRGGLHVAGAAYGATGAALPALALTQADIDLNEQGEGQVRLDLSAHRSGGQALPAGAAGRGALSSWPLVDGDRVTLGAPVREGRVLLEAVQVHAQQHPHLQGLLAPLLNVRVTDVRTEHHLLAPTEKIKVPPTLKVSALGKNLAALGPEALGVSAAQQAARPVLIPKQAPEGGASGAIDVRHLLEHKVQGVVDNLLQ